MEGEKILKVITPQPRSWFAPFYVHSLIHTNDKAQLKVTNVTTIDIYTYLCEDPTCENKNKCKHTQAVEEYVMGKIDEDLDK